MTHIIKGSKQIKTPVIDNNIEIKDDLVEYNYDIPYEDDFRVEKMSFKAAQAGTKTGRQYLSKNISDAWNNAEYQQDLPDEDAERYVDNQELLGKNPFKGFFKVLFGSKKGNIK